jgi:hypothetical protein
MANDTTSATLEISYPKALLLTMAFMGCFVFGIFAIGIPMTDPLLIGFLIFMVIGSTFIFAAVVCFVLRCKISREGLCPAVPTFYQRVLRWEDIKIVRGFGSPFYFVFVKIGDFGYSNILLPRRFLLKRPESLNELIEQYAPADNIVRKKLIG